MNFEALPADEFLEEAQELLQEIEESLLLLEEDPVDQNVIQRLFRSAHTLKGGAAMVGLSDLANYAHEFEAILSQLRSGTLTSTPEIVSALLKGKDNLSYFPVCAFSTPTDVVEIHRSQKEPSPSPNLLLFPNSLANSGFEVYITRGYCLVKFLRALIGSLTTPGKRLSILANRSLL